ncbi:MAG: hypothetical protein A2928_01210 [Candidatus Taylorbacteria bacterium RIFCSPLOWO2_01_FULL_45_15b]|uniref:EfeO-type cupredoxin-like domain-containing protein n=1 Tax=Candidatus Taylorbacteria bacterium RIFCSPLOWO2_01_FULL_45_15b TaxID=1802319 RepID=A0A1G2N806_9BACT|nr:MAG: hypothetical protein A2928_01210 [Candidatus Taylorbacteria bacterium RIFCSPLOWO2_01_FULL_45_15b]
MKSTATSIIIALALIAVTAWFSGGFGSASDDSGTVNNVIMQEERQIIEITAKGGYSPRVTEAKAGVPTTLIMETRGTFDCSSALVIPSIGYRDYLPPSGTTEIELPPQKSGTKLQGLCTMGMYSFTVNFN